VFRDKEVLAVESDSTEKSSAAENASAARASKGPMLGLIGALVFGMFVL